MQNPSPWIMAAVIIAFVAFGVETDIYVPSLPDMASYFGVASDVIQTVLSVNFFSLFIGCLLSGPYSDRFGRRRFLVNGLALFFVSSIACALATNFELLLVMRFLQGLGAGTILGLAMTVVFDVYGTEKGAGKVGFMNGLVTIAMAAAPFAGSKLNQHFSWQAAFWFIVAISGLAYWMVYRFIPETVKPEQRLKSLGLGEVVINYGR